MPRAHPNHAIFSMEHLATLGDAPKLVLVLSERTSYICSNLALQDIMDSYRYAVEVGQDGQYTPVAADTADWETYEEISRAAQLELQEVATMPLYGIASVGVWDADEVAVAANQSVEALDIPEGELWEIHSINGVNLTRNPTGSIDIRVTNGSEFQLLASGTQTSTLRPVFWNGRIVLAHGHYVSVRMYGNTVGDDLHVTVWYSVLVQ